jgi:hypothetical protein
MEKRVSSPDTSMFIKAKESMKKLNPPASSLGILSFFLLFLFTQLDATL